MEIGSEPAVEKIPEEMEIEESEVVNSLNIEAMRSKDDVEATTVCAEVEVIEAKEVAMSTSTEKDSTIECKGGNIKQTEPPLITDLAIGVGDVPPEEKSSSKADASLVRYLASQTAKNCEVVEAAALDFVAGELHHPVISCLREIKKTDIDTIFYQTRFKTEIGVLEQGITCITLMDYIAISLGNPLYSEYIAKNEYSIRPKVKKIFTELSRILKDWAENDPATFDGGKGMIVKFLSGLTPYFKSIQYDKKFAAALIVLEKGAVRSQRKQKLTTGKSLERSALHELVGNKRNSDSDKNGSTEDDLDCELKEDFFDFLDDIPRKAKTAPVFLKTPSFKKSPYFKSKSSPAQNSATKNSLQSGSNNIEPYCGIEVADQGTKRPATVDIGSSTAKKVCLDGSQNTDDVVRSESNKHSTASASSNISCDNNKVPQKEKVNAFVFLMNRSKELAKASKQKKQTKSISSPLVKTPIIHTVL